MPTFKLGKLPARQGAITLNFADYLTTTLPPYPKEGGHKDLIRPEFGMLGNDQYGDCVWAGAAHETMQWNDEAGKTAVFLTGNVLTDYRAVTGFDPGDPSTDQGTDMQLAAKYRQNTGILDASGTRHKIAAYMALPKDIKHIKQAVYLFGAAGIGINFPDTAMTQFNEDKPWHPVAHATIQGGHYVPAIAYDNVYLYVVTWGKLIAATWTFIKKYMDEGVVYLTEEMLVNGKSLEGFDLAQLQADLAAIKK